MENKKEKIAHETLVGASEEQSNQTKSNDIITDFEQEINTPEGIYEDYFREMQLQMLPGYLKTVSMTELYDTAFESQLSLIDGLLCRGTYLFVGAPKVGKSFMMAQLAYHVSTGCDLWGYKVRKCPVLYFALEDDYVRLQKRLYQMFGTEGAEDLYFATESKTVTGGLREQISTFMQEHPTTGLIIIDTLKRVRESNESDFSYANDYDVVAQLKAIADSYKVTMLIVHHTRKQDANDKFDTISGTNGLLGAADGAMLLYKLDRTSNAGFLEITGRDQQDLRIALERDPEKLIWKMKEITTELWKIPPDPLLEQVSEFLLSAGNVWAGTPTELCDALKLDMKPNALSLKLNVNSSALLKDYNISYKSKRCHEGRKILLRRVEPISA